MPRLQIPEKLQKLADINYHRKFIILIGGRDSGKTTGAAQLLSRNCQVFGEDMICLREFQTSIAQSVHKSLKLAIERTGAQGFTILDNKIKVGTRNEIIFNGMARNPASIKSAESYKYAWVEEAESISQESLDALIPTIRKPGSEIWFTANPRSSTDPFSKRFINPFKAHLDRYGYYEDDLHLIIVCNWRDNPWHDEEMELLRLRDKENMSRARYDWIWEGAFNDEVENSIILKEWFDAAVDAHLKLGIKPRGRKIMTFDPADSGDARAYIIKHGIVIQKCEETTTLDVNDSCDWSLDAALSNRVDFYRWDGDGIGLPLKRQVHKTFQGKPIKYDMFHGNDSVENPTKEYRPVDGTSMYKGKTNDDLFRNLRAQKYWALRDRFYDTYRAVEHNEYIDPDNLISISSDIQLLDKLRGEICKIPQKNTSSGIIQIMSKRDMKKEYGIDSPNLADCAMMSEKQIRIDNKKFLSYEQPKRNIV